MLIHSYKRCESRLFFSQYLHLCLYHIDQVSESVNGPMLEVIAEAIGYHDTECIHMFRDGGQLFGFLHNSGNGDPIEPKMEGDVRDLMKHKNRRNKDLVASLREDQHSDVLLKKVMEDADIGRKTS